MTTTDDVLMRRVLVVDDDPGSLEAFECILTDQGFEVSVAVDAEAGFKEIDAKIPAVVLLDLHLPGIDGLTFLRQLRASRRYSDIRVAVLTGDYMLDQRIPDDIAQLGARLFFKPLWDDDLIRVVQDLISQPGRSAA